MSYSPLANTKLKGKSLVSESAILTVEASYRTDITFAANAIETDCHEHLLAPPKGIYCSGKLEACMVDGVNYYSSKAGQPSELITDINTVNTAVYSESGKCVIPLMYMKKRSIMVSNESFMPYRGLYIVKELVLNQIDKSRAYRKYSRDKFECLAKHFLPNTDINELYGEILEDIYKPIEDEVNTFLGNSSWDMYFVKLLNTVLVLERGMDYRAYLWELENGEKWRSGKYSTPC